MRRPHHGQLAYDKLVELALAVLRRQVDDVAAVLELLGQHDILGLHLLLHKVDVTSDLSDGLRKLWQKLALQIEDARQEFWRDADHEVGVLLCELEGREGVDVVEEALDVLVR